MKFPLLVFLLWLSCTPNETRVAAIKEPKDTLQWSGMEKGSDTANGTEPSGNEETLHSYMDKIRKVRLSTRSGEEEEVWIHEHAIGFLLKENDSVRQNRLSGLGLLPIRMVYSTDFPALITCNWSTYYSEKETTRKAYRKLKMQDIQFLGYRYDIPHKEHGFLSNTIIVRVVDDASPEQIDAFISRFKRSFPGVSYEVRHGNRIHMNLSSADLDLMLGFYKKAKAYTIVRAVSFQTYSCSPEVLTEPD